MKARRLPQNPRLFWPALRRELRGYLTDRFAELQGSATLSETMLKQFEAELRALCDTFMRKAQYNKKEMSPRTERDHLRAACQVLGIDPPKPGTQIDMVRAARLKKKLARNYHPDLNKLPNARDQYEAVMQAWDILVDYEQQFKAPKVVTEPIAQGEGESNA